MKKDSEAGKTMNCYRLTNTAHTDIVKYLPLISLPITFGAKEELSLFDDNEVGAQIRGGNEAAIIAQAAKIAELLRATDISYL